MDPIHEQRLRDEVMYLHSLWHQGPPLNPNPRIHQTPLIRLKPSNPPKFKKDTTKKITRKGNSFGKIGKKPGSDPLWVSDLEWPCKEPVESPSTWPNGWPALNIPVKPIKLPSPEEQARHLATQLQEKPLKAAKEFFAEKENDDGDDSMDDEDDDGYDDADENGENKEYDFFLKLFMGDDELRRYYEKNWESGEFCCLVCGGIGEKVGKKFKNCVSLVQHSTKIAKTKKKLAHRAYAEIICKFLGWNINRLPSVGSSLVESGNVQGNDATAMEGSEKEKDSKAASDQVSENVNNCEPALKVFFVGLEKEPVDSSALGLSNGVGDNPMLCEEEQLPNSTVLGSSDIGGDSLMVCEATTHCDDSSKYEGNADNGASVTETGQTEGTVNHLCKNIEKTMVLETNK